MCRLLLPHQVRHVMLNKCRWLRSQPRFGLGEQLQGHSKAPISEKLRRGAPFSVRDPRIGLRIGTATSETMLRFALTIYCRLCLAGCKTSGVPAGEVGPTNSTDATLVTDATAYLRERLNAGDCYRIYSEASDNSAAGYRAMTGGEHAGNCVRI